MPNIFGQLMQQPAVASPTPMGPQMEQQFRDWQKRKLGEAMKVMSMTHRDLSPTGKPFHKPYNVISYYTTDSPALREEFMRYVQGSSQQQP